MYGAYVEIAAYSQVLDVGNSAERLSPADHANYDWLLPYPEATPLEENVPNWQNAEEKYADFILVSEVSEIEGPRPLFTVPANLKSSVHLDKLTERMMSVDYQTSASGPFAISDDTQALLPNVWNRLNAYAHYFTLNDLHARGFVRPMCIAYLSCDRRKLSVNMVMLRQKLLEVTKFLKFGNRKLFLQDMEQYLIDLQKSKDDYVEKCKANSYEDKSDDSLGCKQQPKSATLDVFATSITEVQQMLSSDKPLLDNPHLENILEFVKWQVKHQLVDLYWVIKRFVARKLTSRSKVIDPKQNHFVTEMRNICELCSWGLIIGLAFLVKLHEFFSMDYISIYMDNQDALLLDPPAGALTIGGNIVTNLLTPSPSSRAFTLDNMIQEIPEYYSQQVQEYKTEVKAILDVIVPPAFHRVVDEAVASASTAVVDGNTKGSPQLVDGSVPKYSPNESPGTECTFYCLSDGEVESADCSSFHTVEDSSEDQDFGSPSCDMDSNDGEDFEDACASVPGNSMVNLCPVKSLATRVHRLAENKAGYGIVNVLQKFQCLQHILYSLLIGRPVIVVGAVSSREDIWATVKALCLFVPEKNCEDVVVFWHVTPIRLSDICRYKLIGVGVPERKTYNSIITNCTKNYVTILDVDKMTFQGPLYTGTLMGVLQNSRRFHWDDGALIVYIYSMLLTIARKVNVYYQSICMNGELSDSAISALQSRKMSNVLLSGLRLDGNDIIIVKHLTESVKCIQVEAALKSQQPYNDTDFPRMLRVSHEKVVNLKL